MSARTAEVPLARHDLTPEAAGLVAAAIDQPGLTRRKCGRGFRYLDTAGKPLNGSRKARCQDLAIPPAWCKVWISPDQKAHIQASGYDEAGRKQYLYHPDWRAAADAAKFADLPRFAERLPRLRRRLRRILGSSDDSETLALACAVELLDRAGLRIGSRRHRDRSGAIGALTLQKRNIRFDGDGVSLHFTGKGGKRHDIAVDDPEVCSALRDLTSDHGGDVFRVEGRPLNEADVNGFIEDNSGLPFTAKDFRTWGGSVAAIAWLRSCEKPSIKGASQAAADWLGNTPAIARAAYIHPAILENAREGARIVTPSQPSRLRVDERACYGVISSAD